jgi:hypothetical protein
MTTTNTEELCKCARCGRFRPLFQETTLKSGRYVTKAECIKGKNPECHTIRVFEPDKGGLCEECAVEINKKNYDEGH